MESNRYYIKERILLLLCFFFGSVSGQSDYANLRKVCYKKGVIKVWFKNDSKVEAIAPNLSTRIDRTRTELFEGYRNIVRDTLEIIITVEVDTAISAFRSAHSGKIHGSLSYVDKTLKPGKKYRTKVPINLPEHIRYLRIRGETVEIRRK